MVLVLIPGGWQAKLNTKRKTILPNSIKTSPFILANLPRSRYLGASDPTRIL